MAPEPDAGAPSPIVHVLEWVEQLVLDELEPGASLPSEGDLARRLDVSRLTVREAIKILAGRGLIEVSQGRRPMVAEPSGEAIGGYLSAMLRRDPSALFELLEIRQALEVHTATLAARRASPAAVAALTAAIADMQGAESAEEFHDADVRFHELLALAGGNRMLIFLLEALEAPLRDSFIWSYEGHLLRKGHFDGVLESHAAIVDHIRGRAPKQAAEAMRAQLKQAELDLKAFLRQPAEDRAEHKTSPRSDDDLDA